MLADPERFHGQTLADPLEGRAYGRGKAKVYRNSDGSVVINSFAHGGCVYRLAHDAAFIEAQINEAGEGAPFVLAGLMPHAKALDAVTRERLRNLAAKLGKVSRRAVNATIDEEAGKASKAAIDAARERHRNAQTEAPEDQGDAQEAGAAESATEGGDEDWEERLAAAIAELNRTYFVAAMGGSVRVASMVHDEALDRDRLVFSREADIRLQYAHRHYVVAVSKKLGTKSGEVSARHGSLTPAAEPIDRSR